mmetsp:Transcript_27336/g.80111  ORF Transcript_27336/g.80111 Transcript_27336/m.80111 type:complete len:348 (+) Transcript_27336:477-1520(+)
MSRGRRRRRRWRRRWRRWRRWWSGWWSHESRGRRRRRWRGAQALRGGDGGVVRVLDDERDHRLGGAGGAHLQRMHASAARAGGPRALRPYHKGRADGREAEGIRERVALAIGGRVMDREPALDRTREGGVEPCARAVRDPHGHVRSRHGEAHAVCAAGRERAARGAGGKGVDAKVGDGDDGRAAPVARVRVAFEPAERDQVGQHEARAVVARARAHHRRVVAVLVERVAVDVHLPRVVQPEVMAELVHADAIAVGARRVLHLPRVPPAELAEAAPRALRDRGVRQPELDVLRRRGGRDARVLRRHEREGKARRGEDLLVDVAAGDGGDGLAHLHRDDLDGRPLEDLV